VWRSAVAACNRCPGRQGPRPPGITTWLRGARWIRSAAGRSASRGRQRGEKRGPGSPKPPRWSAERRASRVMGRKAPRKRLACRVTCTPHGCSAEHPNVSRRSAHPSTGVSEAKRQSPDAAMRARERDALFDMVRFANARAATPAWSSPRGAPRDARVAGTPLRGPRTTGRCSWVPALRPLARASAGTTIGWRGGPTCSCSKRARAHLPCFRPVLYRDKCNFNVSRRTAQPPHTM
jgi:hypothetical protein